MPYEHRIGVRNDNNIWFWNVNRRVDLGSLEDSKNMKDLRERCSDTYQKLHGRMCTEILVKDDIDQLEAFAREIRNESLEEAASLKRPYTIEAYRQHIRALKTDTLAAAKGDE